MRVISCGSARVLPFLRNSLSLPETFNFFIHENSNLFPFRMPCPVPCGLQ